MTASVELNDMLAICEARYVLRQRDFAKLVAEENRIRAEIARLDDMNRAVGGPNVEAADMRAIGADMIWRGWLGRAKTALNLKLAQILAAKEHHLKEVRQAYGKVLVVKEMQTQIHTKARKKSLAKALSQAVDMSLMR